MINWRLAKSKKERLQERFLNFYLTEFFKNRYNPYQIWCR